MSLQKLVMLQQLIELLYSQYTALLTCVLKDGVAWSNDVTNLQKTAEMGHNICRQTTTTYSETELLCTYPFIKD